MCEVINMIGGLGVVLMRCCCFFCRQFWELGGDCVLKFSYMALLTWCFVCADVMEFFSFIFLVALKLVRLCLCGVAHFDHRLIWMC